VIRAAAVSALASFAFHVESLHESVTLLIQKCLNDSDDEVRERAYFYYNILSQSQKQEQFFDNDEIIDVDALESYIMENKDELCNEESEDFFVDLKELTSTRSSDQSQPSVTASSTGVQDDKPKQQMAAPVVQ